jgi:hypothetical protein
MFSYLSGFVAGSEKRSARNRGHIGIDFELINPGGGNGTIEREEEISGSGQAQTIDSLHVKLMGTSKGKISRRVSEAEITHESRDFRDELDRECACTDGKQCIVCCTQRDLMAYPELCRMNRVPVDGKPGEFRVLIPWDIAEQLGFDF